MNEDVTSFREKATAVESQIVDVKRGNTPGFQNPEEIFVTIERKRAGLITSIFHKLVHVE